MTLQTLSRGIEVDAPVHPSQSRVLTPEALAFLAELHRRFDARRLELLSLRGERQQRIDRGEQPAFLPETRSVREAAWRVSPPPRDLLDRRVEITGPTERKMMINALNSGANCFMADFEDANTPHWQNLIEGQANLMDAVRRSLEYRSEDGKEYRLQGRTAVLLVRPRGWHLPERHVRVDGQPLAGSLFDFGLYVFHNARELLARGSGPYFYLPKMESHLEARLWASVFRFSEDRLGVPRGSIRATVLIETILAAFEMDEILYELREHSIGLNAGRWDYLFSIIKKFRNHRDLHLPDRSGLTMTVPFMRAYTELLVRTCHRRGAHAMGGMAAFIPNRRDPQVTASALKRVREDKEREARDGFDGTWVAHPDLVPVAREVFDRVLGDRPNQIDRNREDVAVSAADLLRFRADGEATAEGLRNNLHVALVYLEAWLRGTGAVAIHNLMEDAATSEIARSQVWLWLRQGTRLSDGRAVTRSLVEAWLQEELEAVRRAWGPERVSASRLEAAQRLLRHVAMEEEFPEFLTLPAYNEIESEEKKP